MAIAYRSGSTAGNSSGGNVTITKPSGVADGDILIAVCYNEISASAWTPPAGWAQWGTGQACYAGVSWINVYWKRASSEGANYTFNIANTWRVVTMAAFSGALASGDPIDAGPTGYGISSAEPIAASITTVTANTMCIALHGNYDGADVWVGTSGYTRGATSYLGGCEIWYLPKAGTGATGDKSFDAGGGVTYWSSYHLAIKPAAAVTESSSISPSISPSASTSPSSSVSRSTSPSVSPSASRSSTSTPISPRSYTVDTQ